MEENEIIKLYKERSEDAIKETNIKYGSYLKSIAYNILHDELDVEEVLNDTYSVAWRKISINAPSSLKYYLSKITRNLSLKKLEQSLAKKRNKDVKIILSEIEEFIPDSRYSIEKEIESKLITEVMDSFLGKLSKEECAIFISRYYYFMTIKELSRKYSIPERKIKYNLFKLRNKLQELFEREGIL